MLSGMLFQLQTLTHIKLIDLEIISFTNLVRNGTKGIGRI
jgi:hypothetical protein